MSAPELRDRGLLHLTVRSCAIAGWRGTTAVRATPGRPAALLGVTLALALLLGGCGEPDLAVELPERDGHVADLADVLDDAPLETRLGELEAQGLDVVVLTYTTEIANCGEAFRAGGELVSDWDADVAIVAVARPGDFTSTAEQRERCLGLRPQDEFAVSGGLREEIAEGIVPPIAAENRWDDAITAAVDRLAEELLG